MNNYHVRLCNCVLWALFHPLLLCIHSYCRWFLDKKHTGHFPIRKWEIFWSWSRRAGAAVPITIISKSPPSSFLLYPFLQKVKVNKNWRNWRSDQMLQKRTCESGFVENSEMERNSSSETKPLALRSSWQKRSISCCETSISTDRLEVRSSTSSDN
jgi:hypothetical protein